MRKKLLNLCLTALLSVVSTAAWALTQEGGFYQIGTAEDFAEFAALVNGGQKTINAILTDDIDLGTDIDTYKLYDGEYNGVFDGSGHTITINFSDGTKDNQAPALFRSLGHYSVVKRLKVQGNITTARQHAAAIANYNGGVIRDCWVDVTIKVTTTMTDGSAAAIVGQCNKCSVVENCLAKVYIDAPDSHKFGGVAAWSDAQRTHFANNLAINDGNFIRSGDESAGLVRKDANLAVVDLESYNANSYTNRPAGASVNNYVTDDFGFLNKGTTVVTTEELASGKICYQLNSDQSQIRWKQNIGTDDYPVPAVFGAGKGQVYASAATDCQGKAVDELTYSNDGSVTATPHTYDKYGICTTCGEFNWNCFDLNDPTRFDPKDRTILLSSGDDLFLAEGWNRLQNGGAFNMKMANDITCISEPGQLIFNAGDWFESNFNGDGHELTIQISDIETQHASFIPYPYAYRGDFVFENVILHGKISSKYNGGSVHSGAICSREYGGNKKIFRNVYCDVEYSTQRVGDNTVGGLVGVSDGTLQFDNCIYAGDINCIEGGTAIAGFVGWANASTYFNNCAFIGNLNGVDPTSTDTQPFARNSPSVGNCKNLYTVNEYSVSNIDKFSYVPAEAVESGELAFLLNERQQGFDRFYQKFGEDLAPKPIVKEGALVYASGLRCDGYPVTGQTEYANTPSGDGIPSHSYEDGICTICGDIEEGYMTPAADGFYEIGTASQLLWWNNYAAKIDLSASARLTADIDMTPYNETFEVNGETSIRTKFFVQLGNRDVPFYGNFDGQFHTISNLHIYLPGCEGAGFISVINSQPSNGAGGLSDASARAAEGVYVKNVVLEGGSIYGKGYVGLVGMTASWAGHVTISGCLNQGDITADGGTNTGGLLGCVMGAACHITVNNCGYVGNAHVLNDTRNENGLFCGWLGSYAEVTNCFAYGTIDAHPDAERSWARHNSSSLTIKNCYGFEGTGIVETGYSSAGVTFIPVSEKTDGTLVWKLNCESFRNPAWFQTVGEDDNPTILPTHGVIIYAAEQLFCAASDEDIPSIASTIQQYEDNLVEDDAIATQALLDAWQAAVDALTDFTTIASFTEAYYALEDLKVEVDENKAIYQAYIDKCTEIMGVLANDDTFSGSLRDALEYYLNEEASAGEPTEDNPLGLYAYIVQEHTATAEEIQAEIARIDQWLKDAINEDYKPGTDVSRLIPNGDFSQEREHWTNPWCTAFGKVADTNNPGGEVVGVEAWNVRGDMYQTVEGMKPGYYLVGVSGAFRPSNLRYSTNYAAGFYANNIFNFFPAAVEDYIAVADTIDQVNCNLHGAGSSDLAVGIYDDFFSTDANAEDNGATLLGYAVHGQVGMACAANAGRYQAYTIANVGEDGKLTIGFKNPGTKYSNDWTGWGPLKVKYCGNDDDFVGAALDDVLSNMEARAQTILAYERNYELEDYAAQPYFPEALKDSLTEAISAIDAAETIAGKEELAETFSRLFQKVYEGKQAYISLSNYADQLDLFSGDNLPLVEKNDANEWEETGEMVFDDAFFDALEVIYKACDDGSFSTEQALDPASAFDEDMAEAISNLVPEKDNDGYYLLSSPKELVVFRSIVNNQDNTAKAKLVNDIDMIGIGMQPIGTQQSNESIRVYSGTFDGTCSRECLYQIRGNASLRPVLRVEGRYRQEPEAHWRVLRRPAAYGWSFCLDFRHDNRRQL